jgi:hypothetical protein
VLESQGQGFASSCLEWCPLGRVGEQSPCSLAMAASVHCIGKPLLQACSFLVGHFTLAFLVFFFFFLAALGFELRASYLLGRHSYLLRHSTRSTLVFLYSILAFDCWVVSSGAASALWMKFQTHIEGERWYDKLFLL